MASGIALCFGCFVFLILTIQGIGFFTPYWLTDSNCEGRGLFYECCKGNQTETSSNRSLVMKCRYLSLDAALGVKVFALELTGVVCFLLSFMFCALNCCSKDDKNITGCLFCTSIFLASAGALFGFSGGMLIVSDGHSSFGFSFWLSITPGILFLILMILVICTMCLRCCCGDDGGGGKHSLSTCLKFKLPGMSTQRLLNRY